MLIRPTIYSFPSDFSGSSSRSAVVVFYVLYALASFHTQVLCQTWHIVMQHQVQQRIYHGWVHARLLYPKDDGGDVDL